MNLDNSSSTIGVSAPSTEITITPSLLKRFWGKVKKTESCWEWTAALDVNGYGAFGIGKKVWKTHRVSFILANGPIPHLLDICHKCDNPKCVRPDHLFAGTHSENMQDMFKKNRQGARENRKRGVEFWSAKLDPEKVREIRSIRKHQGIGCRKLAKMFGVTKTAITELLKWRSWKDVL